MPDKYSTITADPPWPYNDFHNYGPGHGDWQSKPLPYSAMTLDEIAKLPVPDYADSSCRLFLWATNRYLPDALNLLSTWDFTYKQTLVWHKIDSNLGGSVAPTCAEFLLVGVKGTPKVLGHWPTAVIATVHPRKHSTKPSVFGDLVETVSGPPYLELFAREPRLGWDSWGWGYE